MTADHDLDRSVATWLRDVPPHSGRALAAATSLIATTSQRRTWRDRLMLTPTRLLVFAALAASLIPAAGLLGAAVTVPQPSPSSTPTYEAVLLRQPGGAGQVEIVLVDPSGAERTLRRIVPPEGAEFGGYGSVSPEGWLAVGGSQEDVTSYFLYDLGDPASDPRVVPYMPIIGGAWGPDGRFATTCPSSRYSDSRRNRSDFRGEAVEGRLPGQDTWPCTAGGLTTIQVVDARTGATTVIDGIRLPGGGPDIIWAADGSGLLAYGDTSDIIEGTVAVPPEEGERLLREGEILGVAPPDGGPRELRVPGMYPRFGSRWIAPDAATLGSDGATVSPEAQPGMAPDEASFSADGRSIWRLRIEGERDRRLVLTREARENAPSGAAPEVISSASVDHPVAYTFFGYLAPDDSVIGVGWWYEDAKGETVTDTPVILMPTDGTPATKHDGVLAGFVSTDAIHH